MGDKYFNKKSKSNQCGYIDEMSMSVEDICEKLTKPVENFTNDEKKDDTIKKVIDSIDKHVSQYERLLYSAVSNYIFSLNPDKISTFTSNLSVVVDYAFLEYDGENLDEEKIKKIRKTILKLKDHVDLARYQCSSLKQSDEEFKRKFNNSIGEIKPEIQNELNEVSKSIIAQLISLIAIFTAMSFLVFGGINTLDNIFEGVNKVPTLQLIIVGCVWGLCINNLLFIFMIFIARLTHGEIKAYNRENATLFEKYPLMISSDLIILGVFLMVSWIYYIKSKGLDLWLVNFIKINPFIISILGIIFIGLGLYYVFMKINNKPIKLNKCCEKHCRFINEMAFDISNKEISKKVNEDNYES